MINKYYKTTNAKKAKLLQLESLKTEDEFERMIYETAEILGDDIFLRGENKRGISDIIGIDQNGTMCIIEIQNATADATTLSQILECAFRAKTYSIISQHFKEKCFQVIDEHRK